MRSYVYFLPLILAASPQARGEALSTTAAGLGIRSLSFVEEGSQDSDDIVAPASVKQKDEEISDLILCQRISTPTSLGLEIGVDGCVQGGGFLTFAHSISSHLQLIYYPLAARTQIDGDKAVRLRRQFLGDVYMIGHGGFAKITHSQSPGTTRTLTMDVLEFGGGIGWTYRLFDNVALGLEGNYLHGSILSTAATGSTYLMTGTALITVFL